MSDRLRTARWVGIMKMIVRCFGIGSPHFLRQMMLGQLEQYGVWPMGFGIAI